MSYAQVAEGLPPDPDWREVATAGSVMPPSWSR